MNQFKINEYDFSWTVENGKVVIINETVGETEYHQHYGDHCLEELAKTVAQDMYDSHKEFMRTFY
jgi:hypothetical protein